MVSVSTICVGWELLYHSKFSSVLRVPVRHFSFLGSRGYPGGGLIRRKSLRQYQEKALIKFCLSTMSTSATPPLLLRLVHETSIVVGTAGDIIRKVLNSGRLEIIDKGISDLQTKADRAAQQYIMEKLSDKFPNLNVIGEEGSRSDLSESLDDLVTPSCTPSHSTFPEILRKEVPETFRDLKEEELLVFLDPLDGTREFAEGSWLLRKIVPKITWGPLKKTNLKKKFIHVVHAGLISHVTVLVGVSYRGVPIAGVIHQPFFGNAENPTGRTMWGIVDVRFGGFNFTRPPTDQRILTTTRSRSNAKVEATMAACNPSNILRVGGAGHKIILLIEGKAHAYVYATSGCKRWDTCGPEAILRATGGTLTDMTGAPYKYEKSGNLVNQGGVVATTVGENHQWYIDRITTALNAADV